MQPSAEFIDIFQHVFTVIYVLLFGILFIGILILVNFVSLNLSLKKLVSEVKVRENNLKIRENIEDHLAKAQPTEAKKIAQAWVNRRPGDVQAIWLLAQSHYHLGELVDAKKRFLSAIELAPTWETAVKPWLEKVEEKLSSSTPTVIR